MHSQQIIFRELALALRCPLSKLDEGTSFIANGGDSMSSIELQVTFKRHGINISLESIFMAKTISELVHDAAQTLPERVVHAGPYHYRGKRKLLAENFVTERRQKITPDKSVARHSRRVLMTEMQISLVHSTQRNPGRNIIHYVETHSPENVPALKRAWRAVIESEAIFRTIFVFNEAGGELVEEEDVTFNWMETVVEDDISYKSALKKEGLEGHAFGTSFRVVTFPGWKGTGKSAVIWNIHHALVDGYSCGLILSKLDKILAGKGIAPGSSFLQYAAGLNALQLQRHEAGSSFWKRIKQRYPSATSMLKLPAPSSDVASQGDSVGEIVLALDSVVDYPKMLAYCQDSDVTLAALYHAAWGLLLSTYADSKDVYFGSVLSGRTVPVDGILDVVGPTINLLPLYMTVEPTSSSRDYVQSIFLALLQLTSFQWTSPKHGFTRDFSSALNVVLGGPPRQDNRAIICPIEPPSNQVISDIPLHLDILPDRTLRINYHKDKYSEDQMNRVAKSLADYLRLLQDPDLTIRMCLAKAAESNYARLSRAGNWLSPDTTIGSVEDDLMTLFSRTVSQNPGSIAVERGTDTLTYKDLDIRSSIVAARLVQLVSPGDVVACCADRSIDWIIGIYSVLKVGAIYCPFDEGLPDRIRETNFITAKAKMYLTGSNTRKASKPFSCSVCYSVEEILQGQSSFGLIHNTEMKLPTPAIGAYICFTSGSTGQPKGVLCQHKGLVAFQRNFEVRLRARPGWRIAQLMSPGFDGSIHEIFSTLSYGATLVLQNGQNPFAHLQTVDAAILTPSVARALEAREFPKLSTVYLIGEAVPQEVADTWSATKTVYNMYGPTEATCGATIKQLCKGETVTLGGPNPSTRIYILSQDQQVLPFGVIGEIYLAGVQVAVGYVGDEKKTAERFLFDSVNTHLKETMYKTGDMGYWNENGELVLLGRSDRQVKLRGFRIDLDDLEIRIPRAMSDCSAAAMAVQDGILYAQVQPVDLNIFALREQMRKYIPQYAMPHHIIAVESFPLTRAGKLDYTAIASLTSVMRTVQPEIAYTDASEVMMEMALRDVLNIPNDSIVDLDADFYDMGGTSISQLYFSHRLSKISGRHISISTIVKSPTLRHLASMLDISKTAKKDFTNPCLGEHDVSPIERDWWNKYEHAAGSSAFNVTFACELHQGLDRSKLLVALNHVLDRHRILRCRYYLSQCSNVMRKYADAAPVALEVSDIDIDHEIHHSFDLRNDDLVRVSISPSHMVIVISHIICDLTTLWIVLREVASVYHGEQLLPLEKTYSRVPLRIAPPCHLSFWESYLSSPPKTRFPFGTGSARKTWAGSSLLRTMPDLMYQRMKGFADCQKITMHQLALAAVAMALQGDQDVCDIMLGAPYLNRHSEECQDVVGLFLEPLPIRIRYPTTETQDMSFVKSVQQSSRIALSHAVPWNQLLTHLNIASNFPDHPLFEVMVSFHDREDGNQFDIPAVKPIETWTRGAKFRLMIEFSAVVDGSLGLRLEYSTECFTERDMEGLHNSIDVALEGLMDGMEWECILDRLARSKNSTEPT
jgi:amino acid adenylation domain-containing protein